VVVVVDWVDWVDWVTWVVVVVVVVVVGVVSLCRVHPSGVWVRLVEDDTRTGGKRAGTGTRRIGSRRRRRRIVLLLGWIVLRIVSAALLVMGVLVRMLVGMLGHLPLAGWAWTWAWA
jgi:polyferredoxin